MRSLLAVSVSLITSLLPAQTAPHVVLLVGEREYGSQETMPAFAERLEDELGLRVTLLQSRRRELPPLEALDDADLLVMFLRFREATDAQFARLQRWFDDGKPCVALRTTSHAFTGDKGWFPPFFGGHYKAHAPNGQGTIAYVNPQADGHPITRGLQPEVEMGHGGTYNAQPLADTATPLLFGRTGDLPSEPIAWVNRYRPESRIFYTSLGSRENFEREDFQRMLGNAVLWTLEQEVPSEGAFGGGEPRTPPKPGGRTPISPPVAPPALAAPAGATVLFDGGDLSAWRHYDPSIAPLAIGIDGRADSSSGGETYEAARWCVERGMMVARPGFGDVVSAQAFGNYHLHADVYIPDEQAWVASGARARSGLYLAGRYELEIAAESDGDAGLGAISQQHEPDVELRAERGAWHRLDVHFSHVQDRDPVLSA
ncbi:MAG: ThuA domain-containing protein, partial [Planctomycetota bacterium]|nr:ThuA domain-containing protein [Planctomycetota bacterium]